jgi:hypothetical protein
LKLNKKLILLCLFLASIVGFSLWCAQKAWLYNHPLFDPKWGFQFYVPQQLPSGIHATGSRIDVGSSDGKIFGVSAEMNYGTTNWIYSLSEYRSDGTQERTSLRNFDTNSVLPTCTQRVTRANQDYRLCHWIDYGRISVYEIKFTKNGTAFHSAFPAKKGQVIPMSELDAYVDSFKKADPPKQIIRGI